MHYMKDWEGIQEEPPESNEIISKEVREAICRDIQMIPKLVESIEYLVLKVRESMKALQEIKSDHSLYNLSNFLFLGH